MSRTLYVPEKGRAVRTEVPVRPLGPREVRIKVHSAGVNPIDWKTIDFGSADGKGFGNDYAGTVTEVGSEAKLFSVGDTVGGGVAVGSKEDPEQGAYSSEVKLDERWVFRFPTPLAPAGKAEIPAAVPATFEQAASLGTAAGTTVVAFEQFAKPAAGEYALIYGVTSSVGFYAAQYARSLGYTVIGVSAPTSILDGLDIHWLDRTDPHWVAEAKRIASDNITFAFDAVVLGNSQNVVPAALSKTAKATGFALSNPIVEPETGAVPPNATVIHPQYQFLFYSERWRGPDKFEDPSRTVDRAPQLIAQINRLFASKQIRALPIKVLQPLDKINEGLTLSKRGVKGTKIVLNVE